MPQTLRLLFLAGSAREGSMNKRLASLGAHVAQAAGTAATFADLGDYPMPLYDGDLEARDGVPENARKLLALMHAHQGVFIASPEYNASVSPLLKNALDWISRVRDDAGVSGQVFKTRVFALGSASPGGFGGMRGLMQIRHVLELGLGALVLPEQIAVPHAMTAEHKALALDVGRELTRVLDTHQDVLVAGRITDRTHLGAGAFAQQALRLGGAANTRDMLTLALHMAPLHLAGERPRDAISVATDALTVRRADCHGGGQGATLHGFIARAHLQLGRPAEALPHAKLFLQNDPSNADLVLPIARGLPPSMADEAFPMLKAVIQSPPREPNTAAWTECLTEFYADAERLAGKKAGAQLVAGFTQRMPLPQIWYQTLWGEGYRIWMDPNERPAKIASGKDALVLPMPQSTGWSKRARAPEDLQRWNNIAYCVQRGEAGPTLVVYWFGPNLEYWYGDSPQERGVTGKTVRGHSAGSIARMVFDIVYGEDAKKRGHKFSAHAAPGFTLGEGGQRRTFALGDTVYDETIFSHGQVAVEVLLVASEAQLVELEPELRWMYASLRKD